jgi:PAT family beta-lactamase induction signal transducer AmpG
MVYKLSTLMATALSTKFLMDELHYSKTVIGATNKLFGIIFTILGTVGGGSLMAGLGLKRSLWIFGIVQSLVGVTYCLLARLAHGDAAELWLIIMVSVDNFMMGMGTAALTGFMMKFCNKQFTGTQYALLTSVMAVGRVVLVSQAGVWAEQLGWDMFYISTVPLAIPGLLLLFQYEYWQTQATKIHERMPLAIKASIFIFMVSLLLLVSPVPVRWLFEDEKLAHNLEIAGALGIVLVVDFGV